ncbi:MAG: ABC transporter permease, partial [Bacteroidales bacterium]
MKEFRRQYLQNAVRQMTTIFWNEVIRIFTDSGVMLILFIAGLGYPLLYSFVYYQESVSDIPVAIIDNDASAYSRKFSRELDATKEVQLRRCINMNEAEYLMGRRKVHAIIVLPKDFEKTVLDGQEQATVSVYVNMTSFFVYKSVAFAINFTMLQENKDIEIHRYEAAGQTQQLALQSADPAPYEAQFLFNPGNGFASFFVPGVMILIIHQLLFLGIGMLAGTVREENKNHKLFENQIDKKRIYRVIFGKGLAYFLIDAIFSAYITVLIPRWLGLPHLASPWDIYRLLLPFLLAVIFFSLTCSVFIKNRETGMVMFLFFSVILLFLSGVTWPRSNFPVFWKAFSYLFPSTFAIQGFNNINTAGCNLAMIRPQIMGLTVQCIIYGITSFL